MSPADSDSAFELRPPILLVGTQRSGTTFFGSLLNDQPGLAYWEEPRHIWTRGNVYTKDDRLTSTHATPRVRAAIRKAFAQHAGENRFCEKTPSNCMRLPFIRKVLPEARILFIIRDGRSVLRSTGEIMNTGISHRRIIKRARQTPIWEWPAFLGQTASTVQRKITKKPLKYWGPRPPNWRQWIGLPRDELLAHQWAGSITTALDDAKLISSDHILVFRYEDLMLTPRKTMTKIASFLDLDNAKSVIDRAEQTADPSRMNKWRTELSQATLETVKPIMLPVLERLEYEW